MTIHRMCERLDGRVQQEARTVVMLVTINAATTDTTTTITTFIVTTLNSRNNGKLRTTRIQAFTWSFNRTTDSSFDENANESKTVKSHPYPENEQRVTSNFFLNNSTVNNSICNNTNNNEDK